MSGKYRERLDIGMVRPFVPAPARGHYAAPAENLESDKGSVEYRLMEEASPIIHVTLDDPPFLLLHGDADPVVPFDRSAAMRAALEEAGVDAELTRIPGGGHGPGFESTVMVDGRPVRRAPQNAPDYIGAMIDWFDRHLIAR